MSPKLITVAVALLISIPNASAAQESSAVGGANRLSPSDTPNLFSDQALRYLHGSPDMPKHISKLKNDLDARTKKDLAALTPKLPAWMRPPAQQITQT